MVWWRGMEWACNCPSRHPKTKKDGMHPPPKKKGRARHTPKKKDKGHAVVGVPRTRARGALHSQWGSSGADGWWPVVACACMRPRGTVLPKKTRKDPTRKGGLDAQTDPRAPTRFQGAHGLWGV